MQENGTVKRILVVDDEAINRLLLVTALKKRSFETMEAKNGTEALQLVEQWNPHMVLLDVMMPDLTGFEVCRTLKNRPGSAYLPIILVTALHSQEDVEQGIAAGADEFISKPVDINELMVRVRTLLKISEMQHVIEEHPILAGFGRTSGDEDFDLSSSRLGCSEADHLIQSMLKSNLAGPGEERNKPAAIYLSLGFGNWHCRGRLYNRDGDEIREQEYLIDFPDDAIASLGSWQEGVFLSNWQDRAESPEAYRNLLPPDLAAWEGGVQNFLLYAEGDQRIIFMNFGRRLQLFDLTWYRHLGSYISMLIRIFAKMGQKEEEYLALARSLGNITEIKDGDPGKHERIRHLVTLMCRNVGCSGGYSETLVDAVGLYDIGKLLMDQSILSKDGPLSEREWDLVRKTPQLAALVIEDLPRLATAREIAVNLYERYDGSGYPLGRQGREIPFSARLVRMVDVYESLRSNRSFRDPFSHQDALQVMEENRDHFDPELLDMFLSLEQEIEELYTRLVAT